MHSESKSKFYNNYKKTVEFSPNGTIILDRDLIIHCFNNSAERLTMARREDVIGKSFNSIFPEVGIKLENFDGKGIQKKKFNNRDLNFKAYQFAREANDESVFVLFIYDENIKMSVDPELEHAEKIMNELEDIIEYSFDGILVTDGEANVLLVNEAYIRNTGIQRDQLMGHNMRDLINPVWMKNSVAILVAEQKRPITLQHITQNNKNIIVTGTPIFNKNKDVIRIVINARDVSEIYNLQEELLKAKEMEKLYFKKMSEDVEAHQDENPKIVINSDKMKELFLLAKKLADFNTTVLITGESGVGKEVVANYIHENSTRSNGNFVAVNCGSIPENLLESELFGYTEGSFTGAVKGGKPGLFEAANNGTLFLDEIGEMSTNLQVKLLRAIESRCISRLGSSESIPVDIRIIAATNQNLNQLLDAGLFREDLFYRLNVVSINIPPLRERTEDIPPMVLKFLNTFNMLYGQKKKLTYDLLKELEEFSWPGNVRQLKNVIENMVVVSNNEYLQVNDLPWISDNTSKRDKDNRKNTTMREAIEYTEQNLLREAKEKYKSTRKMAKILDVDQSTIARKLKKYNI